MKKYDPKKIEKKWQGEWLKKKTFEVKNTSKNKKKMVLVEFPYPSGAGLHMGHMRPFVAGDVTAKYFKLRGFNTMYPMGWDAFGLPAENYAIKNKVHPKVSTATNVANAKKQLLSWGTGYDWSREVNTTDPNYYKWTQKLFLEFYKAGLAYEKFGEINWCPKDKTGLANEEVVDGKCDRCGAVVEKKNLRQWYLKITDYAEKLLEGIKNLPEWPESVKIQQENWIGKSEGAEIEFKLRSLEAPELNTSVKVFTTRVDTLFGVTYLVLAPENKLVEELKPQMQNWNEVEKYINEVKNKTDIERTGDAKEKAGVILDGIFAVNPVNKEKIPVWIADYVLNNYGTGAVMAVPAHDQRDFEFAKKYNLPIRNVINPKFEREDVVGKTEFKKKNKIVAIVEDGKGNILVMNWGPKMGGQLFLGGTIEEGEDPGTTALRELKEEAGYTDVEIVSVGEEVFDYKYFSFAKGTIFDAATKFVHLRLKSMNMEQHAREIQETFNLEWLSYADAEKKVTEVLHKYAFDKFIRGKIYGGEGTLVNSGKFDGMKNEEAKKQITESAGGRMVTKYKLRDWVFSRQRYWGEPIPLVHCLKCGIVAVPDKDLPVKLPEVKNYEPTGTGESPLAAIDKWVNVKCPKCILDAKKTKYLVFDFDGVIGDTREATLKNYFALNMVKTREEAEERLTEWFDKKIDHLDGEISDETRKYRIKRCVEFGEMMKNQNIKIFNNFVKEIKKIKNAKIAFISSGSSAYVLPAIKSTGLKYTHCITGEVGVSKLEEIKKICEAWKISLNEVHYFTDANSDYYQLDKDLDTSKIIGCAWGFLGEEKLLKVFKKNSILKNFKDIHKLFEICDAKRETNTMPQWAGSSWYWLRYMDPKNKKEVSSLKSQKYWSPVDLYFGGMEHTTLHLLYSRFWNLFFYDRGLVTVKEPYKKRVPHGIILGPDGEKMSKSRGNVVNPDDVIKIYGADTTRLYMMFLGPHGAQVAWNDKGIVGTRRFLDRVWAMQEFVGKEENNDVTVTLHKTIKKVGEDIETFSFNTAVSSMMIFVNTVYESKSITKDSFKSFLTILSVFAPHITEEIWNNLGNKKTILENKWPIYKNELLIEEKVTVVVQVNGKIKAEMSIDRDIDDEAAKTLALGNPKVEEFVGNSEIKRVIVVKNRLINIVI